jgi:spore coat protein U-like protein
MSKKLTHTTILRVGAAVACIAAFAAPQVAGATTTTGALTVKSQIQTQCTIDPTATLDFGPYAGLALAAQIAVNVNCSSGGGYDVGLSAGGGGGGTATTSTRAMTGQGTPANQLSYSLWQNLAHTTPFGNSVGTDTLHKTGIGANDPFTIFGTVPASQALNVDTYQDSVTMTVTY